MGWQSIQTIGASACVIFILLQNILKMAKCTFWYQLTQFVPDQVQRAIKWLCVCVCVCVVFLILCNAILITVILHIYMFYFALIQLFGCQSLTNACLVIVSLELQ